MIAPLKRVSLRLSTLYTRVCGMAGARVFNGEVGAEAAQVGHADNQR